MWRFFCRVVDEAPGPPPTLSFPLLKSSNGNMTFIAIHFFCTCWVGELHNVVASICMFLLLHAVGGGEYVSQYSTDFDAELKFFMPYATFIPLNLICG